jgi:ATP-binding cassette subfamily B protein
MAGGMPTEKSLNFKASVKRLLGMMRPERAVIGLLLVFGVTSVVLSVLGPKILGHATDIIFSGLVGKQFPAGIPKAQIVAQLRQSGNGRQADMLAAMNVVPGQGIDMHALGQVLLLALLVAVLASAFGLLQGRLVILVVNRLMYRVREQVEAKLARLPLSYFDKQQRGEVLSRATNDTDNIAQTLQQTMGQMLTSLLTIVGVLGMMLWTSPLLALIALVTVPVSVYLAATVGKKAQPQFIKQWATTGKLNGHIEEMYTGHALVKTFGRHREALDHFNDHNTKLYEAGFRAQFISGIIQPAMFFIGNINYVLVAVVGGLRVATGAISLGDVQAFIQYSRQFTQPLTLRSMANLLQSGVASAERVFAPLHADEQEPDPVPRSARSGPRPGGV